MSSAPQRAVRGRFVPLTVQLAVALGNDVHGALAHQTLFFYGSPYPDGWVALSEVALAAEIGCTRHQAREALTRLVEQHGVVELQKGAGSRPDQYRVCQGKLRELVPHDTAPQPQFTVEGQQQTSGQQQDSGKSSSRAGANDGREDNDQREANDERKQGTKDSPLPNGRGRDDGALGTDGAGAHEPPTGEVEEEVTDDYPSPPLEAFDEGEAPEVEPPTDAADPSDDEPSNANGSDQGEVDIRPTVAELTNAWKKEQGW